MLGATVTAPALLVRSRAYAAASYDAVGRIVSIAPGGNVVHIAHEAIPGVMGAMTMSFTARSETQLVGFGPGDRVAFRFTVTDDGRRLLDVVRHRP